MMVLAFVLGYPRLLNAIMISMTLMVVYIIAGMKVRRLSLKSYIPLAGFIMMGIIYGLTAGGGWLWEII